MLVVFLQSLTLEPGFISHVCSKLATDVDGLLTQFDTRLESEGVHSLAQLAGRLELRLQSGFLFRCKVKPLRPLTET